AEAPCRALDQRGVPHRGGVDRDLVGSGREHGADVLLAAQAAADRERDEDLLGSALGELDDRAAPLVAGGDVEEDELVGPLPVVAGRELHRVAGVAQPDEVDALDHAAAVDVETGDDPDHVPAASTRSASATVKRPS